MALVALCGSEVKKLSILGCFAAELRDFLPVTERRMMMFCATGNTAEGVASFSSN